MSAPDVDTVRRLFERFDRDGLDLALELISEDFVVEVPGSMSAEPDVYRGHDGARRYFAGFDGLMEEVRFEPIELVEHRGAVIVWLRLSGRGAASGIEVDQHAAVVTWLADGKVTRMEPYPDMDAAREALDA
jgi:ketosteroid isomerase-like protein